MPRPGLRTNFLKRIRKKLPGGVYVIHYKKTRPSVSLCADCKKPLKGTVKGKFTKIKNVAKTVKKPTRKYSGNLCGNCAKTKISQKVFQGNK